VRRAQLRDEVVEGRAAGDRDRRGHQATPGEGEREQGGRLPLQEVELADREPERHGEQREQPGRGQRRQRVRAREPARDHRHPYAADQHHREHDPERG
jgi:hypothetical protein